MADKRENYSVLMSVYDKEKPDYLRESMQSIYDQTVPTNDFVLVCDGPLTDELDKIIHEMKKKFGKRLRIVRLDKNYGLGHALNVGVEECRNELIARMDADDISVRDRIEKQIEAMKENGADVVGSNIAEYDENMDRRISCRAVPQKNEEIIKMMKKRNPINHMTVLYKKSKVIESGNYIDMPGFEDYYLWCRVLNNHYSFFNVQECLVNVRAGMEMLKRRSGRKYNRSIITFQKEMRKLGIINGFQCFMNIFIRICVSSCPDSFRMLFYGKALRD